MKHTIFNTNSIEYMDSIPDNSYDLILTDPPYDFNDFVKNWVHTNLIRIARNTVIVFSPPENQWILPADQYLFWIKPISTKNTSKHYSRFVEMMFVYHVSDSPVWNTNRHWSQYTNVFTDLVDSTSAHAFRKPPSLIERLILNHSNEWDSVFDPFCGSGVVGEVCGRLNRDFFGIEMDKQKYEYALEATKKYGTQTS